MKNYFTLLFAVLFIFFSACTDSDEVMEKVEVVEETPEEPTPNPNGDVNNFIWSGLNLYYLWQGAVDDLADDRFSNDIEYNGYIQASGAPEDFFESLLYRRQSVDIYSWIVDDYVELENQLSGISKTNGVEFGLSLYANGSTEVFGYVEQIVPGSDADGKEIKRGDFFTEVDGIPITTSNYRDLLFSNNDSYSLTIAKLEGNTIVPTGVIVDLTKYELEENPIFVTKVFEEGGRKIGYILYDYFNFNYNRELNAAFLDLKSQGVTDLILDMRYNPGGRGSTAIALGGMITGQFKDEVFMKDRYNNKLQPYFEANFPEDLLEKFTDVIPEGEAINSLNLNSLHCITTEGSASAVEYLIMGLKPYINVTVIGERTAGKNVGSTTLYDSEDFGREGVNSRHNYAMQPIIVEAVNKNNGSALGGIPADVEISEDITNLGVLGDSNEPLLRAAINDIIGVSAKPDFAKFSRYEKIDDYRSQFKYENKLIVDRPKFVETLRNIHSME